MYTDMRDFEAEYVEKIDGYLVKIAKVGGGTVGQKYEGNWEYFVLASDSLACGHAECVVGFDCKRVVIKGSDLYSGMPHSHAEMAAEAVAFANHYAE